MQIICWKADYTKRHADFADTSSSVIDIQTILLTAKPEFSLKIKTGRECVYNVKLLHLNNERPMPYEVKGEVKRTNLALLPEPGESPRDGALAGDHAMVGHGHRDGRPSREPCRAACANPAGATEQLATRRRRRQGRRLWILDCEFAMVKDGKDMYGNGFGYFEYLFSYFLTNFILNDFGKVIIT